jgi:hypothetical protein
VVLLSGESGEAVLQEMGRRVCAARGLDPAGLDVHWSFRLPRMANILDRDRLAAGLKEVGAEVLILDPLYLCLLAGVDARGCEASNLFDMGPLLLGAARACLDVGCTPLLCHHAGDAKARARGSEPMDLGDLAFAGIQEFSRQWLLLNRRDPFDPDAGSSRLWLSAGGAAGQSGCWAVDVEEGVLRDDFAGRRWETAVTPRGELAEAEGAARSRERDERAAAKDRSDDAAVLAAIDRLTDARRPTTRRQVRDATPLNSERFGKAVERLRADGLVEECEEEVAIGSGAKRRFPTLNRTIGTNGTVPMVFPDGPDG